MGPMATRRSSTNHKMVDGPDRLKKKKKKGSDQSDQRIKKSIPKKTNKSAVKAAAVGVLGSVAASLSRSQNGKALIRRMSNFASSRKGSQQQLSSSTNNKITSPTPPGSKDGSSKRKQEQPKKNKSSSSAITGRPVVSSTTTSVIALISTSTSRSDSSSVTGSSQQVSIAMYHQESGSRDDVNKSVKMSTEFKHVMDTIERVASGQWIDSDKIKRQPLAVESPASGNVARKETTANKDRSIHLRNRSVSLESAPSPPASVSSVRRPVKRRRLACLNAMAKVHCLYDNEIRPANGKNNAHRQSRSSSSDSSSSSSSSSSEEDSDQRSSQRSSGETNRNKGHKAAKKTSKKMTNNKTSAAKKTATSKGSSTKKTTKAGNQNKKKQRQSMEVPAVNLALMVTPKRMASLNATAILAASSQHWSSTPKRPTISSGSKTARPDTSSDDDSDESDDDDSSSRSSQSDAPTEAPLKNGRIGNTAGNVSSKPRSSSPPAILTKKKLAAKKSAEAAAAAAMASSNTVRVSSSSAGSTFHQSTELRCIEERQMTGTKSSTTYHAVTSSSSSSSNASGSSSKTFRVTSVRTSSDGSIIPSGASPTESQQPSYSPLGALFNMRPPHQTQQPPETTEQEEVLILSSTESPNIIVKQDRQTDMKMPTWPSHMAERQPAAAVNFGGVPLVLANPTVVHHHPAGVAESYAAAAAAARLTPAFSFYRPDSIPFASFYPPPPTHHHPAAAYAPHFPPYYRGFALLPPPGSGFVPVALADSVYSAYALGPPPPPLALAGPPGSDHLSYYLHRYHPSLAGSVAPPRYLAPDWTVGPGGSLIALSPHRETTRSGDNSGAPTMHGDRNPLPLAASEAAPASSATMATSTSNSRDQTVSSAAAPKLENVSSGTTVLTHSAHSLLNSGYSAAYPSHRCLSTNCSCNGPSTNTATCPKNVQAGLLTGEGKKSVPNPCASQSIPVIPHPSCRKETTKAPPNSRGGSSGNSSSENKSLSLPVVVPSSQNGSPFHPDSGSNHLTGSLLPGKKEVSDPPLTPPPSSIIHENPIRDQRSQVSDGPRPLGPPGIRKRKSDVLNENGDPASPVSSRLRSRNSNSSSNSSSGCGVEDCLRTTCCCDYQDVSKEDSLKTGGENGECIRRSLASDSIVLLADDTNGNHHYAMDHELEKRQRFGSDILMALADKISGRKGGRKKQLLHPGDLSFLDQFNTSLTAENCSEGHNKGNENNKAFQQLDRSDENRRKKLNVKRRTPVDQHKGIMKAKENTKLMTIPNRNINIQRLKTNNGDVSLNVISVPSSKTDVKKGSKSRSSPVHPPSSSPLLRWSNGWAWEGSSYQSMVYLRNEDVAKTRKCYPAMRHAEGDVVRVRDCILLKSGPKAKDLPYVAKVSALWESAEDGEMMMSLLWYYRPEHTDGGRRPTDLPDEVFASRHRDVCSVACIEDKCYVLTFNEYCRYRKQERMAELGLSHPSGALVPFPDESSDYPRRLRLPPTSSVTAPDRIFLCRKVYDFRQKRILKNPN